jgi:hypothetical protein
MIYLLLGLILLVMVILLAPITLKYNSAESRFQVKWLGLTFTKRLGEEKPRKIRKKARKKWQVYGSATAGSLWRHRDLLRKLFHQVWQFLLDVWRTLVFRECEAAISLPDPMLNGLLYGMLINTPLPQAGLWVNFEQRNYARIAVTVYPYRVAGKFIVMLFHLPYLKMLRLARDLKT